MKHRIYSDLHLDHYFAGWHETRLYTPGESHSPKVWFPPELPDDKDTVLLLSGDLGLGTNWIDYCGFSWIEVVASRFKQVIVVLGNHDYWNMGSGALTINNGSQKCNDKLVQRHIFNVRVLDSSVYALDDILYIGCTLWTDMNKGDPLSMHNMPSFMHYDGKIANWTGPNGGWERFTSQKWVTLHHKHKEYIRVVARDNSDTKVVVMTHHIPILGVGDPEYIGDSSNAYYQSDLSDIILDNPNIKMWTFGHSHHCVDIEIGSTRLINRAVGYAGEHREQQGLVIHDIIDI